MLHSLNHDLRYSLRSLLARPGFLVAAVLTLALGIGANIAIFSVVNALLIKPLPFPDAERLVLVYNAYPGMGLEQSGTSIPDYLERREQVAALEDLGLYSGISLNLASEGAPQRLTGVRATPSLFSTLQVAPALGQVFSEDHAVPGRERVLVLSHGLWQSQFAGDRDIIGRQVRVNGHSHQVIGVMPAGFAFPTPQTQAWVPFAFTAEDSGDQARGNEYSESVGRLAPGATPAQAQAQMAAIIRRNAERIGAADGRAGMMAALYRDGGFIGATKPLREEWVGDVRPVLWLLQAVAGFVLLIACANVANLMLARLASRRKELAVRNALGAGRRRIARQLLIEALLLAFIGAVAGLGVAWFGLKALAALGLADSPLQPRIGIDLPVLVFALVLTGLTGIAFGLFPALAQGRGVVAALKESGRGSAGGRRAQATRNLLAMVQIGLCAMLLVGAGLLLRSYGQVQNVDPGFAREGRVSLRLALTDSRYPADADIERFIDQALDGLQAIAGVSAAAFANHLPFSATSSSASYQIQGTSQGVDSVLPHGLWRLASDDLFTVLDVPLLAGRLFNAGDHRDSGRVVIIDELLARKQFGDADPIGRRLRAFGSQDEADWATIIGVVGSVRQADLASEIDKEAYYFPYRQFPYADLGISGSGYFVVASDLPAAALTPAIRQAVQGVDPEQPVFDIRTLDERIAQSLQGRQAPMLLLALFAGVALLLAGIGIYAVLAWSVAQRSGELGVRMAIGAGRGDVVRMVLLQGGRIAALGLAAGLLAALALGGFLGSQLYGVSRFDPATFLAVALVLGGIALIACWLPARRAARVDPITALRQT